MFLLNSSVRHRLVEREEVRGLVVMVGRTDAVLGPVCTGNWKSTLSSLKIRLTMIRLVLKGMLLIWVQGGHSGRKC